MDVLKMEGVCKSFGGDEVLKGVSLSVGEGEVVAVIGPSGSGKSTLLRCATMLETMDSGSISFLGEEVAANGPDGRTRYADPRTLKRYRSGFGLVFQSFNLFPHFTVLRNITDAAIVVQKRDRAQAEEEAMGLLRKMGLEDKAGAYPCQLSGGQQQRVSIARALELHPELLFFDEPTSALDPELTGEVLGVMRKLAEDRMTMVVVTHEMGFARDVASKVLFMDKGSVLEEGTPDEIFGAPRQQRVKDFIASIFRA